MLYIRRDGMFPPDDLKIPRMGDFLYSHLYDFTGLLHCVRNDKGGEKSREIHQPCHCEQGGTPPRGNPVNKNPRRMRMGKFACTFRALYTPGPHGQAVG